MSNIARRWRAIMLSSLACVALAATCADAGQLEIGIDRSNLINEDEGVRQSTLEGIQGLHATWFRDAANASTANPKGRANLVDTIQRAKALHLKVLLNIIQLDADYDDNNAGAPRTRCGWSERKLSTISQPKLSARLETLLGALKSARLEIDAFEIGNEDDTSCYNGDIPDGRYASEQELRIAVLGYAHFLQTVAETVKRPEFYPQAKLITFGIAHGDDRYDNPPHHVPHPARMIQMLRDLDGVDYLDNPRYRIDGIGTHIYAAPNDIAQSIEEKLQQDAAILGRGKPFWITEWGFLNKKAFPNRKGQSLGVAVRECLATFERLQDTLQLGPVMFYSYNNWVVEDGRPTQAAEAFRGYAGAP